MIEPRREPYLDEKPVCSERVADLGMNHLERDRAIVPLVVSAINDRHPAATDFPLDSIVPRNGVWNDFRHLKIYSKVE
jgi:hypothetical protein